MSQRRIVPPTSLYRNILCCARFSLVFIALTAFGLSSWIGEAHGQEPVEDETQAFGEPVLWLWEPGESSATAELVTGLKEALAGEGARHLFGAHALERHLKTSSAPVPSCIIGLEPCVQGRGLALSNLGLALVIRLTIERGDGSSIKVNYAVMDRRGELTRQGELRGPGMREVAYELVREIFDATGHVAFETAPAGASITIDGESVGASPLARRLPVGTYAYRVELADHRVIEGSLDVGSASSALIRHDLALLAGTLQLQGAPPEATLFVNEVALGPAAEAVELEPGHYTIEVRAEGFETYRETVRIAAGTQSALSVNLVPSSGFLGSVSPPAIASHRFGLRLGYETSLHTTTFRNARQVNEGREIEFRGFSQDGVVPDDGTVRRLITPHGLRLGAYVTGEYFGLELLSLSWLNGSTRLPAEVEVRQTQERIAVDVVGLNRLQLRPFQLTFRYFYENIVPHVDAGTGISFQSLRVEGLGPVEEVTNLRQTEAFWSLGVGAQYYFSPRLALMARYGVQGYFNQGLGLEHVFGLSLGIGFQNVFGFEAEPPGRL